MSIVPKSFRLTLAATLSAMAIVVSAADAPARPLAPAAIESQQPAQEAGNIDEIWVRGKRLTDVIVDVEDELFKLYNAANKDSDYDIHCGTTSLSSGSMIMIRKCVPGFIVYNSYSPMTNSVTFGSFGYGSCSNSSVSVMGNNGEISYYGGGFSSGSCTPYSSYSQPSGYAGVPAGLLLMERGQAYANNVVRVVSSDPRMVKMANHLIAMYDELDGLQHNFVDARKAGQRVRKDLRGTKPGSAGPRAM